MRSSKVWRETLLVRMVIALLTFPQKASREEPESTEPSLILENKRTLLHLFAKIFAPLGNGRTVAMLPQDVRANCAEKGDYRLSFSPFVVYYRQSRLRYLRKNCADNGTVPITRRRHVE